MANGWTPERKARQSIAIQQWRPWQTTKGPATPEGKAIVAMNSWRGNQRGTISAANRLTRLISEDDQALASALASSRDPSEG